MDFGVVENSPLRNMFLIRKARTARSSSWDRTGANSDNVHIKPGETHTLLEVSGAGCVTHFYWTTILHPRLDLRKAVLRMYWDGQDTPSVEAPLGDFFGAGNCIIPLFTSNCLVINQGTGVSFGFNCYFPMPFSKGARITLTNDGDAPFSNGAYWYHIEYEQYDGPLADDVGRFHAQFRRECLTQSVTEEFKDTPPWDGVNVTGDDNYVILEAEGQGQFVGMVLNVDNVGGGWWGEGDDMIFVDGEPFPPRYHGTGSEEIFGGGAGPNKPYCGPYTGFSTVQAEDYARNTTMYRQYVHDPVRFSKSIKVSIEHGHANNYENDYSSVAYWYQTLPAAPFPTLPPVEDRMPLPDEKTDRLEALLDIAKQHVWTVLGAGISEAEKTHLQREVSKAFEDHYMGRWAEGIQRLETLKPLLDKIVPPEMDEAR